LPYYQEAFSSLGIECNGIANAALKILNHLGIEPILLQNERCCGHDQYWQGEMDTFRKLAELNLDMIRNSKATRIVTSCPECAYTLKHTYREEVGDHGMEVLHLVELLEKTEFIDLLDFDIKSTNGLVTYQDPCRLGRYAGIYQQPRDLIQKAGYDLVEMEHNRRSSICCGTSCWSTCGQTNKKIQSERLEEARSTGANTLITTCVKCQIHLKCAQQGPQGNEDGLEIHDLTTIIANGI
jgi:Fe-S oxidoreductase